MDIQLREERPSDIDEMDALVTEAFAFDEYSHQNEAAILAALRKADALTLSLLAELPGGEVVGQIAFSPVEISDGTEGWLGLGPLSVDPRLQRCGIGSELMEAGLKQIRNNGAAGCVVLGEPGFYSRFGFASDPRLIFPGAVADFFMVQRFEGEMPEGLVSYHPAFDEA